MTDLVVLSLEAWDGVWRRNQHLIAGLLRADPLLRVLFVEPAADPLHAALRRQVPATGKGLRRADRQPGIPPDALWLYQPTKLLPRRLDHRVDERLAEGVARQVARLGFERPVLWVNDPAGASVLEATGWPALYDITDDWLEADRTPAEHERLIRDEGVLMRRCGEVVVCSPHLAESKGSIRPVTLVQNGVDVEAYHVARPRPADLPEGPVALYVGTLHTDRIDLDLCVATAEGLAERGRLVMVGPVALDTADRQRLERAGAILAGPRHRDEVPAYLQHADVLVVPHVVTPFTDSLDPIKVYEYRAVGRPVVSTPVAGFRDLRSPRTTVAQGPDFVSAVRMALPATTTFPEGADPNAPTWAQRVREMAKVLDRLARPGAEQPADSP